MLRVVALFEQPSASVGGCSLYGDGLIEFAGPITERSYAADIAMLNLDARGLPAYLERREL